MKISFVSPCGGSGGVLYPMELAEEMRDRGHEITFWMVAFQGESPTNKRNGVRFVVKDDLKDLPSEIATSEAIICTNWQAVFLVSEISDSSQSPLWMNSILINLIQGDERKWGPEDTVSKLMSQVGWKNIFVSKNLRDRMVSTGISDGPIVHDGIANEFFEDLEMERTFDIGFLWSAWKNSEVIIPSLASREIFVLGIGEGPPPDDWDLFSLNKLWMTGRFSKKSLSEKMKQCRFWLCPSGEEGFGLVPVEAMACGTIPIPVDIGVMSDIRPDVPFSMIENCSSISEWRSVIDSCMNMNDEEWHEQSEMCRKYARRFEMKNVASAFEKEFGVTPRLSVCMIVKNGKQLLENCLTSIDGLWDELIIVIDEEPEDGIEDICLSHGATVSHRALNRDFAGQRNHGFDMATGDFILWLDSDDIVPPETISEIKRLVSLNDPDVDAYYLDYHYAHDENGNVITCLKRERLLRRESGWRWKYEIHEICECDDPQASIRFITDFPIIHRKKFAPKEFEDHGRNLRILTEVMSKYEDDPRMLFYAAKENLTAGNKTEALRFFKMVVDELSKIDEYDEHLFVSCIEIACLYNEANELPHARKWAYKALDTDPRWAETYCLLGNIAEKMGDNIQAIDMFKAAKSLPIPKDVVLPVNPKMYDEFPSDMISRLMSMDVIIPVHGKAEYLELCLSSLDRNSLSTTNAIIVANPVDMEEIRKIIDDSPGTILIENGRNLTFAENCNIGILASRSEKVCLLNSDTIVTPGWDEDLINILNKNDMCIAAAFSNGEYGWRHNEEILVDGVPLVNVHRIDTLGCSPRRIEEVGGEWARNNRGKVEEHDWVTFAACAMSKHVFRTVGLLDEKFKNSMEDSDYCIRLKKIGGRCFYSKGSFVFHFCGTTRYPKEGESFVNDDINNRVFQRKIDLNKMKVTFYLGESWESWTPDNVNTTGIGGSETCVVNVAKCLSDWGWNVDVYSTELDRPLIRDGVIYRNHKEFDPSKETDVLIVSRKPFVFDHSLNAKVKILYNHDATYGDEDSPMFPTESMVSQMDALFVLSDWHKRSFIQQYPHIPEEKFIETRNGIDIQRFNFGLQGITQKDMKRCFYSSSADRGLEVLLKIWPRIREIDPELELHIFYGMETWQKSIEMSGDQSSIERMNNILTGCQQPGIIYRGRMGQRALAREMMMSNLWLYPTWFGETACITGMETLASLSVPITTPMAALTETLSMPDGDNRVALADFVNGDCLTDEYQDAFVEKVKERLSNPVMDRRAVARDYILHHNDWRRIASEWTDFFIERM